MSNQRRRFSTEYKVEAAHRVIDSGRYVASFPTMEHLINKLFSVGFSPIILDKP